jgi:hypothetical protein
MKIISFYTGHYEWDAQQLIKSMNKLGISNYDIQYKDRIGSWARNTQIKADFILEKLLENDSVVWTDADSRIKKYPELFDSLDQLEYDVGFFFISNQHVPEFKLPEHSILDNSLVESQGYLQSGTMYFKNTVNTIKLLNKWIELNKEDSSQWDQWTLQKALNTCPEIKLYELPPEYVWIDNTSRAIYGSLSPVVYHTQASRRYKNVIK